MGGVKRRVFHIKEPNYRGWVLLNTESKDEFKLTFEDWSTINL